MPFRIREILLVASPYDAFIFAENEVLTELIFSEYRDLNLTYAPRVTRVDTGAEALALLDNRGFDMTVTMMRVGELSIGDFAKRAKESAPEIPLVLLAYNPLNIARLDEGDRARFDGIFLWSGDIRILLAIIKHVEDMRNADPDIRTAEVQTILLVENSVRYYSYYLPILYTEVMSQTQRLLAEGVNLNHRILRRRARPKILLARNFEEAWSLYERYRENLLCLITDNTFEKDGEVRRDAGLELIRRVKEIAPDTPVLLQTSDAGSEDEAERLKASFVAKGSHHLLEGIRRFLQGNCGFGDFVFRLEDGSVVGRASDLASLLRALESVPVESIVYHAAHNHFSKWLKARTEFVMAHFVRPKKPADFESPEKIRSFLIETISGAVHTNQIGQIIDFSHRSFTAQSPFVRVGQGAFGGKGRGLAFLNAALAREPFHAEFPEVRIRVPNTVIVTTDVFDDFLDDNDLLGFLGGDPEDAEVVSRFLEAELPLAVMSELSTLVSRVDFPLAVRSSSLMEDSQLVPLAGVYETYMLPNNHEDASVRLEQLSRAIRLVFASTFFKAARVYLRGRFQKQDQEKMAVVIQRISGSAKGSRFYPCVSGVAQSYNYYPVGELKPEEGMAFAALGLGKTVVEGRRSLRFSPEHPDRVLQFSSARDMLANSQRKFIALDLSRKDFLPGPDSSENLLILDLSDAERDGALAPLGSTYVPASDRVYPGIYRKGVRLVTLDEILNGDRFPLAGILRRLLAFGERAVGCPVEIEYAVDLETDEFDLLQIRPMMSFSLSREVRISADDLRDSVCRSPNALGHGQHDDIFDLLYVKPSAFEPRMTSRIAREIGVYNSRLREEGRRCVLIGPGRWGSADHSLGIPVSWSEISEARLIVETTLPDFLVEPSFGTHFLHNVISLGVGYLSVRPERDEGAIDWDWLDSQKAVNETSFLRQIRTESPFSVRVDGRERLGAVLKPSKARGASGSAA